MSATYSRIRRAGSASGDVTGTAMPPTAPSTAPERSLGRVPALLLAGAGGALLACAFPPVGFWPFGFLGPALVLLALRLRGDAGPSARAAARPDRPGRGAALGVPLLDETTHRRGGALIGFVAGLGFYAPLVSWSSLFLGVVPWLALAVVGALTFLAAGVLVRRAYALVPPALPAGALRVAATSVAASALWTLREAVFAVWPYGGFAWGRVAQSQVDGPFAPLVSWIGTTGLTFVAVLVAALAVEGVVAWSSRRAAIRRMPVPMPTPRADARPGVRASVSRAGAVGAARSPAPTWIGVAAAIAALALVPVFPTTPAGSVRVAAVQGDTPEASYFAAPHERGAVLRAHLAETATIPADAAPDVVLWPEGSVDLPPQWYPQAASSLTRASLDLGVPIIANTVTVEGDPKTGDVFNSTFVWDAEGGSPSTGAAASAPSAGSPWQWTAQYDKAHPVPFGEYIPDRDFWYALAPDLIGMIQRGYTPGTRANTIDLPGGARAGVFICFDIVDDALVRAAVLDRGADVLFAPTNNADFGRTAEAAQQLAIARLRAIESGRALVQVSTVGLSAVMAPDGSELASLPWYEPGTMLLDVPRTTGVTSGILLGPLIAQTVCLTGVALLVAGWASSLARRSTPARRRGR